MSRLWNHINKTCTFIGLNTCILPTTVNRTKTIIIYNWQTWTIPTTHRRRYRSHSTVPGGEDGTVDGSRWEGRWPVRRPIPSTVAILSPHRPPSFPPSFPPSTVPSSSPRRPPSSVGGRDGSRQLRSSWGTKSRFVISYIKTFFFNSIGALFFTKTYFSIMIQNISSTLTLKQSSTFHVNIEQPTNAPNRLY